MQKLFRRPHLLPQHHLCISSINRDQALFWHLLSNSLLSPLSRPLILQGLTVSEGGSTAASTHPKHSSSQHTGTRARNINWESISQIPTCFHDLKNYHTGDTQISVLLSSEARNCLSCHWLGEIIWIVFPRSSGFVQRIFHSPVHLPGERNKRVHCQDY